jgi:hypothetical protein
MATAIAVSDERLQVELQDQQKQLGRLREKLKAEQCRLEAANVERDRVVEAIERGVTGKEAELQRAKVDCESSEIRVGGLRKLVTSIDARIRELTEELGRRAAAAARAAREEELRDRAEKNQARTLKFRENLAWACKELFEIEQENAFLASGFGAAGIEAVEFSRKILYNPPRPREALRSPEVHLAAAYNAGLVPFGFDIVTELRPSTGLGEPGEYVSKLRPGPAFSFTILPMGPRAS